MTLKEINVLETSNTEQGDNPDANKMAKSLPAVGSALGAALTLGMTAAETVEQTA